MLAQIDSLRADGVETAVETFPEGGHLLDGIDFWAVLAAWLTGVD